MLVAAGAAFVVFPPLLRDDAPSRGATAAPLPAAPEAREEPIRLAPAATDQDQALPRENPALAQDPPAPRPTPRDLDRAPLRGVTGRVVEAGTGRPIAGAWITWRVPPPELVDQVLADRSLLAAGGGMVSDAAGRFSVDRLPDDEAAAWELHAVAAGHAPGTARAGLAGELEIALVPCGALEVRLRGPLHPVAELALEGPGPRIAAPARSDDLLAWRLERLAPGEWTARLDGAELGRARVVAGQLVRLELDPPARVSVRGVVADLSPEELSGAALAFSRPGSRVVVAIDPSGDFAGELPPGRWDVGLIGPTVELPLAAAIEVRPGLAPLRLSPPPREILDLLLRGAKEVSPGDELALVALDGPAALAVLTLEVGPDQGGTPVLRARGQALRGRHALLLDGTLAGELTLPATVPVSLQLAPFTVEVRWRVPSALGEAERLRGRLALLPAELPPAIAERLLAAARPFRVGPRSAPAELTVYSPGRYRLAGESDLGPFAREVVLDRPASLLLELR